MTDATNSTFDRMQATADHAKAAAKDLGFSQLEIVATHQQTLAARIAQSAICRENVWRDDLVFHVTGTLDGRSSSFSCPAVGVGDLTARIKDLRTSLPLQSQNKEYVPPRHATGTVTWRPQTTSFDDAYTPEAVYEVLARHCARARERGWRVTGFFEAKAKDTRHEVAGDHGQLSLATSGHAATLTLTVDDQATGAVGTTTRASLYAPAAELDRLVGEAMDEAMTTCAAGAAKGAVEPGDYTVVLHPTAVADIVNMPLVYDMYDQRKVDEGRTFLAGKLNEINFPDGLTLTQTLNLNVAGASYGDLPLNERHVACSDLRLIHDGRIGELFRTPFWSAKLGLPETFGVGNGPPMSLAATPGSPLAGKHKTLQDLIASTERGIYVANMWYLRLVTEMDGVLTGMTRDGLFEIRDGKITRPLVNMRWHDNLITALSRVTGLTDERQLTGRPRLAGGARGGCMAVPALRIENFHFSSATKF